MKSLILIGAPGSGKGTQSSKLIEKFGYKHVSTGDLLRSEIKKGSDLGKKVSSLMESGQLVDDQTVLELLKANVDTENFSYIFDGYPRNAAQANALDEVVLGNPSKAVGVFFNIDLGKLKERLVNRRMTADGKNIYNLVTNPPKTEGICDITGQELIQRKDDKEDVVTDRLDVFRKTAEELAEFYKSRDRFYEINADADFETVFGEISKIVE